MQQIAWYTYYPHTQHTYYPHTDCIPTDDTQITWQTKHAAPTHAPPSHTTHTLHTHIHKHINTKPHNTHTEHKKPSYVAYVTQNRHRRTTITHIWQYTTHRSQDTQAISDIDTTPTYHTDHFQTTQTHTANIHIPVHALKWDENSIWQCIFHIYSAHRLCNRGQFGHPGAKAISQHWLSKTGRRLNERSQMQKTTYPLIPFVDNAQRWQIYRDRGRYCGYLWREAG